MHCHLAGFGTASRMRSAVRFAYAKLYSRSHDAVIQVYDEAGQRDRDARPHWRFQRVVGIGSTSRPLRGSLSPRNLLHLTSNKNARGFNPMSGIGRPRRPLQNDYGKEYINVTVSRAEPDGIVITFSMGDR